MLVLLVLTLALTGVGTTLVLKRFLFRQIDEDLNPRQASQILADMQRGSGVAGQDGDDQGLPSRYVVRIAVDGVETEDFALEDGGWIALGTAPDDGAVVTAGFEFDVPVRFAEDRLDISGINFAAGEAPSVPLVEIREEDAA